MRKLTSVMALLLALVMVLSFCACKNPGTGDSETTGGDDVTVETFTGNFTWKDAVSTLATNWNPHTYENADDRYPLDYITSGLYNFIYNDDLNPIEGKDPYAGYVIVPEMAAEMPVDVTEDIKKLDGNKFNIPDDATKGYAYKIALNPDAKWQDGTPINADSYVYSMKKLLDPNLMNYRATDYYDGDLAIAGANNYSHSGRTVKKANSSSGDAMAYALSALVKDANGAYKTPDGAAVYIGLDDAGYGWLQGDTLSAYEGYFPEGVFDQLRALADDKGYVPCTDAALDLLFQFTGSDVWGNETRDQLGYYLSYDYTYSDYTWDTVGCLKTGEYEITLVLEKSLTGFYLLYNLTGNWLVYQPLYDANIKQVGDTYTSTYYTSVDTTMSYGPYKMVSYQKDKSMRLEKNENWFGYSDGKHVYKDPEDGKTYPMYQTTAITCEVVAESETRKMMFLAGQLMGYGLQAEDFDTYRNSKYCYATPATTTFFLILNGHQNAIAQREAADDFDTSAYDLQCLTLKSFKQAMTLSYDKELFASTISPSRSGGYGLIGTTYVYDPETGARYRDTDQAKQALCDFYAVDVSKYDSLDDAVASITGYDVEGARKFFKQAFDEAIEKGYITDNDGDGKSDQTVKIEYCLSADSDFMTKTVNYLNSALAEVLKTTPFEGKIQFVKSAPYGNAWFDKISSGMSDTVLGGWQGSALNPFSLTDLYTNSARAYDAAWFSAETVAHTIKLGDEEITMTLKQWSDALNGTSVEVNGKTYNYGDGQADVDTRLTILASLETRILQEFNYLPMLEDASMALLSQQVYYVVEEYNPVMGRGGLAYTKYNFNDEEWAAYVAENNNNLKY